MADEKLTVLIPGDILATTRKAQMTLFYHGLCKRDGCGDPDIESCLTILFSLACGTAVVGRRLEKKSQSNRGDQA